MLKSLRPKELGWRFAFDLVAAIAMVVAAATIVWGTFSTDQQQHARPRPIEKVPLPAEPISLDGTATLGNRQAKLVMIEYGDFQCPACRMFAKTVWPEILQHRVRTGSMLFAFKHFPLERIHAFAVKAAEAAECARQEDKFWEMHDSLFSSAPALDQQDLYRLSSSLGLSRRRFAGCLAGAVTAKVRRDVDEARHLKFSSVPSFVFGDLVGNSVMVRGIRSGGGTVAEVNDWLTRMSDSPGVRGK